MVQGLLLRAISLMPERPEAYFLLSECYENNKEWQEAYTWSVLGEEKFSTHLYTDGYLFNNSEVKEIKSLPQLRTNVGYPGCYGFAFERAIAGWGIGLYDESLQIFKQLSTNPRMLPVHIMAVKKNLDTLSSDERKEPLVYIDLMYERLKIKFPGAREIKHNYSECYQDMFVLSMLNGKRDGIFFEIGCGDPFYCSNTALLEEFGWKGTSIDLNEEHTSKYPELRKSFIITADATKLNYDELIDKDYDYLQIDIEPPLHSLDVLLKIPFERHKFAVITFEHDDYSTPGIKERSRKYLESHGYLLIAGDIAPDNYNNFEDWWIHPDLVNKKIYENNYSFEIKRADRYMLNSYSE
jgi:SAM-dependent methyltransferase